MKKSDYVEKAKTSILNRIKFHAPILYDDKIDRRALFENGVNLGLPIFKFDKILSKKLVKAFELAQREEKFNLLLTSSSLENLKEKKLKNLSNVVVYNPETCKTSFVEAVNKLNINYPTSSNYNLIFKDKFFKVENEVLNPQFDDFSLKQHLFVKHVVVKYEEFVLNGVNFFVSLKNRSEQVQKINLELNIPLKKGYYYFKKMEKCVLIENLLTKEKTYLNFACRNAKFSFSNVDGLENSVFCCVNIKLAISLKAEEENFAFFNFGTQKFMLKNLQSIKKFEEISKIEACKIFNVQVKTKNLKFDQFFNQTLPKKIWINWLNGTVDSELEHKYVNLKKLFIRGKDNLSFVNFKEIGLKEIGVFNGQYYKKIVVVAGFEQFLKVGNTKFFNVNGITNHSLKSKEPVCLCFGS